HPIPVGWSVVRGNRVAVDSAAGRSPSALPRSHCEGEETFEELSLSVVGPAAESFAVVPTSSKRGLCHLSIQALSRAWRRPALEPVDQRLECRRQGRFHRLHSVLTTFVFHR